MKMSSIFGLGVVLVFMSFGGSGSFSRVNDKSSIQPITTGKTASSPSTTGKIASLPHPTGLISFGF
ncbi:MAG: hypothetical protein KGZ39_02355 [Simkania sp.]|nr:hypothetical protein [Simkania sp.]